MADEAIPRAAENIALAIGALCEVRTFSIVLHSFKIFKDSDQLSSVPQIGILTQTVFISNMC